MANKTLLLQLIKQMKDYLNKMEKFKDIGELAVFRNRLIHEYLYRYHTMF